MSNAHDILTSLRRYIQIFLHNREVKENASICRCFLHFLYRTDILGQDINKTFYSELLRQNFNFFMPPFFTLISLQVRHINNFNYKNLSGHHLKSLSSRVRSLISMPESLIAAIVLGSSSRAVSANFARDVAALPIAYKRGSRNRLIGGKKIPLSI